MPETDRKDAEEGVKVIEEYLVTLFRHHFGFATAPKPGALETARKKLIEFLVRNG